MKRLSLNKMFEQTAGGCTLFPLSHHPRGVTGGEGWSGWGEGARREDVRVYILILHSPLPALTIPPHQLTAHQPTTAVSHAPPPSPTTPPPLLPAAPPVTCDAGVTGDMADCHDDGDARSAYDPRPALTPPSPSATRPPTHTSRPTSTGRRPCRVPPPHYHAS